MKSSLGTSGPRYVELGPISLCVSLNQARPNALVNSSGFSMKRREIFSYAGSNLIDKSVVNMVGLSFLFLSNA